jgi:hypothetical protein
MKSNYFYIKRNKMNNCNICQRVIKSKRRDTKYCSSSCKQKSYYDRKNGLSTSDQINNQYQYSYDLLDNINDQLSKYNYTMPYYEYCYIRACHPHIIKSHQIVSLVVQFYIKNIFFLPSEKYLSNLSEFSIKYANEVSNKVW